MLLHNFHSYLRHFRVPSVKRRVKISRNNIAHIVTKRTLFVLCYCIPDNISKGHLKIPKFPLMAPNGLIKKLKIKKSFVQISGVKNNGAGTEYGHTTSKFLEGIH